MMYAPPPGPPPSTHTSAQPAPALPACDTAAELATYVRASLPILAARGWLPIPLPADLSARYAALFSASSAFFALPPDAPAKTRCAAPSGAAASDEGFAAIPGEKQLITLRRTARAPGLLRDAAADAWGVTGELFLHALEGIADTLELADLAVFDEMAAEARGFEESKRASSLLRLFRYERPPPEASGGTKKIVAESHKDIGLLTLVVGASPGLDARDPATGAWVSVEDTPRGDTPGTEPRLTATLLAGQTLTYLTQGLYAAGVHRVSVLPARSPAPEDAHRFSLVFALRPATAAIVDTARFEASPLIPPFPPDAIFAEGTNTNYPLCSMRAQPAGELMRAISARHWNVNVAPEVREGQKAKLMVGVANDAAGQTEDKGKPDAEVPEHGLE